MSGNNFHSTEHFLKRLEADVRTVHTQLGFLEIAFKNLQESWVAIIQSYRIFKEEIKEAHEVEL